MANWALGRSLWDQGVSVEEISDQLGLSLSWVKQHCYTLFPRRIRPVLGEAEREQARLYYQEGKTLPDIAEGLQVSVGTIVAWRKEGKWPRRCVSWTPERAEEAVRLYQTGMSALAVRRHMRTKGQHILDALKAAGIQSRGKGSPMEKNCFWKGGRKVDKSGYIQIKVPGHPYADEQGYMREHRLVMETMRGRYLTDQEVVHHKNGVPDDNRPENLELFSTNGEHLRHELTGKCPNWSEEGRTRIAIAQRSKKQSSTQQ